MVDERSAEGGQHRAGRTHELGRQGGVSLRGRIRLVVIPSRQGRKAGGGNGLVFVVGGLWLGRRGGLVVVVVVWGTNLGC